ncbi:MFS sugar transporter-like protein [Calycina marina]|uniref:MFS sugar transporter-like protein n=1 Tax=Calycina marina TaxID=1763456 RepID=A0A9P7Z5E9_9HELO|nr:MFS sugar transporter-like protein [Calycina marina]
MSAFRKQFVIFTSDTIVTDYSETTVPPGQLAKIVSILSAGTFFGSLLAAPMGDRLGRRLSLIISVVIFSFGALLQTAAMHMPILVAGRFFAGLGVGIVSVLVPLYQSEMAPKWIRGTLVCAYQLAITTGILLASIVNLITAPLQSANAFRIPFALQFVWAGILLLGLIFLPETPRYLIKRGLPTAAAASLSRLRRLDITHPALIEELAEIEANHEYEMNLGPSTYRDVFIGSPHLGRRLFTGCGMQMLQQLSGCNFLFYYGTSFFSNIGISSPFIIQLVMNIVNVVSTIPGMMLVETLGRRRLLMGGAIGMAVCQFTIATVGTVIPEAKRTTNLVLIVFACIYIFFFASTWGPVPWVVTAEIYPLKVRAKSMSLSTASNWFLNFVIAYATPYLVTPGNGSTDLASKIFFVWGSCCVVAFFFVWLVVYETSKISLEQIDEMYERVDHAWNSTNFQPSWSFQEMLDEGASASGVQPDVPLENVDSTVRQRTGTSASNTESEATLTEEDKIIAQLGTVDLSY